MLVTKHEGITFQNQTIYISGQAFVRCRFLACTLVLREATYYLEGCAFERCNWYVDRLMMWGSPESVQEMRALLNLIEAAQQSAQQQGQGPSQPMHAPPSGGSFVPGLPPSAQIPFTNPIPAEPFVKE